MAWETRTEWNLATNPKLTDPYGTIAVPDVGTNRANRANNPRADATWSAQYGTGGAGTSQLVDGMLRMDWSKGATAGSRRVRTVAVARAIPVTPGETITVSLDVASSKRARIALDFNLNATWVSSAALGWTVVSVDTTAPTRLVYSRLVPDGVNSLYVFAEIEPSPAAGDWLAAGRLRVGEDGDYIDGDSVSADPRHVYGWAGTPGASPSWLRWISAQSGSAPRPRRQGGADAAVGHPGDVYAWIDGDAVRVWCPTGSTNAGVTIPGISGDASGTAMAHHAFTKGKSYAAGVLYSQDVDGLGGTGVGANSRHLRVYRRTAAGTLTPVMSSLPDDVAQADTLLTVAWTIDPSDTDCSLVLQSSGPAGTSVQWRNLIICEGDTQAEALEKVQTYFDGSSPGFTFNDQYVKPRWEGTPFQSKSFFTWKSWVPDPPPTIQWDDKTKMSFQAGLDRGVLYLQDGTTVPWNGLTSVNTYDEANTEVESYYVDGLKLLDVSGYGEFEADLSAFTTPKEFDRCVGLGEIKQGLSVAGQQRESFGLSYRTLVGDSQKGLRRGYKIHLIYGATALSESESHETLSGDPAAMSLSWKLKTVAQHIPGRAPSAHLIIDTRYMYSSSVAALEAVLYGADQPPRLPTPTEVLDIIEEGAGLRVIDNGDGTFSVESDIPNAVKEISSTEFEIDWETVETTVDTYTVKSF